MARGKVLIIQRTIYLSKEMCTQLDQLALRRGQGCKTNDLIREALRGFLDEQAEVMASRRHFQKSFQARIDQLETALIQAQQLGLFFIQVAIQLQAIGLAHLISLIGRNLVTPQQLIQRAVIETRKEEAILTEQVQTIREMAIQQQP
jgi:hypothetical protein